MAMSMKCVALVALLVFVSPAPAVAQTPMAKVVALITELKAKVEADGKGQQQSYDKYACWCEKTLGRKATDISDAKTDLEEMQKLIMELKGELGTHGAEIAQLNKDIATNMQDQKDAKELRNKQNVEYESERGDSEQCIGALEAAIGVLTGAGGSGKKFLQTDGAFHQAELLSVTAGIKGLLGSQVVADTMSQADLEVVKHFIEKPQDFSSTHMSALQQKSSNPFGDYAPQSSQIQGILKGMYDAFTSDLEKANVEEADKTKAFEELLATKEQEHATLTATLEKQTADESEKKDLLAKTHSNQDSTDEQMRADEVFFADTKKACKAKAQDWATVTRLRTMELQGMGKAIEILSSPDAQRTFSSATTTFVQLSSVSVSNRGKNAQASKVAARALAVQKMRNLATKYDSMGLAQISVMMRTGGHFDKVITMIDKMIETLRKEEAADIEHRDRCQNQQDANENQISDLKHFIKKTNEAIGRMEDDAAATEVKIETKAAEIEETKKEMKELLDMRNEEHAKFVKALEDDMNAKDLMEQAINAMTAFYKKNKIPLELVQGKGDPEYSVDKDKAPETTFGGDYGGRKSESGGIISIMSMLVEDLEKEIKTGRADDADAQKDYEEDRGAMRATRDAANAAKVKLEKDLADTQMKIEDAKTLKAQKNGDLDAQNDLQATLAADCEWVKSDFEDRRTKRKTEIDGLMDAKNILAGVEPDDELEVADE